MPYQNYKELRKSVIAQTHRKDTIDRFDDFLAITDVEIRSNPNGALKMNLSESVAVTNTVVGQRELSLPDELQSSRNFNVNIDGGIGNLEFRTPDQLFIRRGEGSPYFFTIRANQIEFDISPDKEYQVEITYTKNSLPLTSTEPVNDILTKYPNIYLFGCLKQAFIWAEDTEEAAKYDGLFSEAIDSANMSEHEIKYQTQPQETVAWAP